MPPRLRWSGRIIRAAKSLRMQQFALKNHIIRVADETFEHFFLTFADHSWWSPCWCCCCCKNLLLAPQFLKHCKSILHNLLFLAFHIIRYSTCTSIHPPTASHTHSTFCLKFCGEIGWPNTVLSIRSGHPDLATSILDDNIGWGRATFPTQPQSQSTSSPTSIAQYLNIG